MNSTSRVVRIKPKYRGFPPTCACSVVRFGSLGLRGRGRRSWRIPAKRCAIRRDWLACDLALAAGKVSGGTVWVSVTCGAGAAAVAAPKLGDSGALSACTVGWAEICGVGAASSAAPALSSGVGEAAGVGFAMGGWGAELAPSFRAARGVRSVAPASWVATI